VSQEFDDGQKTEDPSHRRLQRAHEEGRVAQSREINTFFMLGAIGIVLVFVMPSSLEGIARGLGAFADPERFIFADGIVWEAVGVALLGVAKSMAVPFAILVLAAIAGSVVQTGFVFATERITFDASHISPLQGLKRLFSLRGLVELAKSTTKVFVVGAVAIMMLKSEINHVSLMAALTPEDTMIEIDRLVLRLLTGILCVLTVLAGIDYVYQRLNLMRGLRMSRREVREEQKQAEGDPLIRARLRQIRLDRARKRMMAAVPGASVVITNPTHYAVALKYELGDSGAPTVVAKGTDLIALKIREVAEENGVPIVENPPLARALHAGVELDREIPQEHYKAVAEIIGYVFRLKGKIRPRAPAM
jgi:flagellar biosynthesis protein FlhB